MVASTDACIFPAVNDSATNHVHTGGSGGKQLVVLPPVHFPPSVLVGGSLGPRLELQRSERTDTDVCLLQRGIRAIRARSLVAVDGVPPATKHQKGSRVRGLEIKRRPID